jgi:hypothetical protein
MPALGTLGSQKRLIRIRQWPPAWWQTGTCIEGEGGLGQSEATLHQHSKRVSHNRTHSIAYASNTIAVDFNSLGTAAAITSTQYCQRLPISAKCAHKMHFSTLPQQGSP